MWISLNSTPVTMFGPLDQGGRTELYNLACDIGETENHAKAEQERIRRMSSRLESMMEDMVHPLKNKDKEKINKRTGSGILPTNR